jgi:hypothetical protein
VNKIRGNRKRNKRDLHFQRDLDNLIDAIKRLIERNLKFEG